jgi:hypothetical protein
MVVSRHDRAPATADRHLRQAQYFRAMALNASTTDVALSLLRLAVHHERLVNELSAADLRSGESENQNSLAQP